MLHVFDALYGWGGEMETALQAALAACRRGPAQSVFGPDKERRQPKANRNRGPFLPPSFWSGLSTGSGGEGTGQGPVFF